MILKNNVDKLLCAYVVAEVILVIIILLLSNCTKEGMMRKNKICMLHISGDISDDFNKQYIKEKSNLGICDINTLLLKNNIHDFNKLTDSIKSKYNTYDAFVIMSDNYMLEYMASSVCFMFDNLRKPIIFTNKNLIDVIKIASVVKIPEVMVYSEKKLLRACCTTYSYNKFISPEYPALTLKNCLKTPTEPIYTKHFNPKVNIIVEKMFQLNNNHLKTVNKIDGIIFETNGAKFSKEELDSIRKLADNNVIIIIISESYLNLEHNNIIVIDNITTTSAFCKLHYLLSNVDNIDYITQIFMKNLRGELPSSSS